MAGSLAVTRISDTDVDPRQIRYWVETCLDAGDEECQTILLFDGDPPNIEVIKQAQIILDLL
jgi:5,10-methylenetetrahydrofolate reductase